MSASALFEGRSRRALVEQRVALGEQLRTERAILDLYRESDAPAEVKEAQKHRVAALAELVALSTCAIEAVR